MLFISLDILKYSFNNVLSDLIILLSLIFFSSRNIFLYAKTNLERCFCVLLLLSAKIIDLFKDMIADFISFNLSAVAAFLALWLNILFNIFVDSSEISTCSFSLFPAKKKSASSSSCISVSS